MAWIYRHSFNVRPILAILLLVAPSVAGVGLAVSFIAEMYVLFRYHLTLMTALCCLSVVVGFENSTPIAMTSLPAQYHIPIIPFIQALVVAMYSLSAIRKLRNGFTNGNVIKYGIQISLSKRRFKDHMLCSDRLLRFADKTVNWSVMAKLVVAGELTIGVLLAVPSAPLNVCGIAMAVVAQASFTMLFPRTLLPFTLAVLASLVLWL
jgi:hypothetical protein